MSSNNGHNGHAKKPAINRRPGAGKGGVIPPVEHQFKPGNNGHGGGRPKGSIDIWARIRRELMAVAEKGPHAGEECATIVAKAFVRELKRGRWPHMQELINREEGKVPDRHANADGTNIELRPLRLDGDREL